MECASQVHLVSGTISCRFPADYACSCLSAIPRNFVSPVHASEASTTGFERILVCCCQSYGTITGSVVARIWTHMTCLRLFG